MRLTDWSRKKVVHHWMFQNKLLVLVALVLLPLTLKTQVNTQNSLIRNDSETLRLPEKSKLTKEDRQERLTSYSKTYRRTLMPLHDRRIKRTFKQYLKLSKEEQYRINLRRQRHKKTESKKA